MTVHVHLSLNLSLFGTENSPSIKLCNIIFLIIQPASWKIYPNLIASDKKKSIANMALKYICFCLWHLYITSLSGTAQHQGFEKSMSRSPLTKFGLMQRKYYFTLKSFLKVKFSLVLQSFTVLTSYQPNLIMNHSNVIAILQSDMIWCHFRLNSNHKTCSLPNFRF